MSGLPPSLDTNNNMFMSEGPTMETDSQKPWMHTVALLNALRNKRQTGSLLHDLKESLHHRKYLYAPSCSDFDMSWTPSVPPRPVFSMYGPSNSQSVPGGPRVWEAGDRIKDVCSKKQDLLSDRPEPLTSSQRLGVTESRSFQRTPQHFSSVPPHQDPCTACDSHDVTGHKYLYGSSSEISGFVTEGFPARDHWASEVDFL